MFKEIMTALSPFNTLKLWTVDLCGWSGGSFESFWFKRNAMKYAKANKDSDIFIDIRDEITDKRVRLYDHSDKFPPPSMSV